MQQPIGLLLGNGNIGTGTTNQQRLKTHVQQFVNRMKKESDVFYKEFVQFCYSHRDISNSSEFHENLGQLLLPYGDLLMEVNKMLHGDFQYEIPAESINTTLKTSRLANPMSIGKQRRKQAMSSQNEDIIEDAIHSSNNQNISNNNNSKVQGKQTAAESEESRQNVRDKFKQFCQVINEHCPSKMTEFVQALKNQLDGQDGQMKLFIKTCTDFFSDNPIINKHFLTLFAQQIQDEQNSSLNNSKNLNNNDRNELINIEQSAQLSNQMTQKSQGQQQLHDKTNNTSQVSRNYQKNKLSKNQKNNNKDNILENVQSVSLLQNYSKKNGNLLNDTQMNPNNQMNYKGISDKMGDITNMDFKQSASMNNLNQYFNSNFNGDFGAELSAMNQKILNIPGATKNEQNFIYLIDKHMDPIAFMNMLKLLYLFLESIITASEMVQQGSYLLQGFANPEQLIEQLKELVDCRENSRRKATPFFKPLNDLDFNNHERFTHSYVEMPKFYPKYCSNSTELTRSVLNTSIVTVPYGTEHVTFSIMRKNQYEEQLFKSEDEKYEFDRHIQMYKRTIKTLEQIETSDDLAECRKLMQLAIDLKMLVCLYKNGSPEQHEICEILMSNPKKTVVVALERVRAKLHDIEEAKENQAKKLWHEVAEKNFHRSLDHRSFIFKRHDRKFTLASRFEKEPEFRNLILAKIQNQKKKQQSLLNRGDDQDIDEMIMQQQQQQRKAKKLPSEIGMSGGANINKLGEDNLLENNSNNQEFESDPANFFQFLNTFQGTTNVEKCSHADSEKYLVKFDYLNETRKFTLPMMTFIFENEKICSDAFSLLMHYQAMYAPSNAAEKVKTKRIAMIVLKGLFGLNFQIYDQNEYILTENKTIKIATEIEDKIFEKVFAYLKPAARENEIDGNDENDMDDEKNGSECSNQEIEEDEIRNNGELLDFQKQIPNQKSKPSKISKNSVSNALKQKQQMKRQDEDNNNKVNEILENGEEISYGQSLKEMSYFQTEIKENIYQPLNDSKEMQTFYGTKSLYVFIRFFYVLYERLLKAHEISNSFEDNEKTKQLTAEEKLDLGQQRYHAFKAILLTSLKTKENKYEDFLRSIFGKQAFLLFTIDKTLQSATKSLQSLSADELGQRILSLFVSNEGNNKSNPSNIEEFMFSPVTVNEEITYAKINKIILDSNLKNQPIGQSDHRNFFRFSRHLPSNILYINYIDSCYKNWENDILAKTKDQFQNYTISPNLNERNSQRKDKFDENEADNAQLSSLVYLSRNKRKNEDKIKQKIIKIHQKNNIEYVVLPNATNLLGSNSGKEDILISSEKLKRKSTSLEHLISVELIKKKKFDAWIKPKIDAIVTYQRQYGNSNNQQKDVSNNNNNSIISSK